MNFNLAEAHKETRPKLDTFYIVFMSVLHAGAVAAFFCFSWKNLVAGLILYVLSGLGITVGYHRMLTHLSFRAPRWVERFWAVLGTLALQGGPIMWVAQHRQHHSESDTTLDPHNIQEGFLWAHFSWVLYRFPKWYEDGVQKKYAPDLLKDPVMRFLEKYPYLTSVAVIVPLALIGGWSMVFWGFFLRVTAVYHFTWFVNSAAHVWGYRPFKNEIATNNWWVALVGFGEGWHNNHHGAPTSARHGLRWWELDTSWMVIWTMSKLGLAHKIKVPTAEQLPWNQPALAGDSETAIA